MTRYESAKNIAAECGSIIIEGFRRPMEVSTKSDPGDYVTDTDKRSEAHAIELITRFFPEDGILSEESGSCRESATGYTWVIDPLDGTANFVRHIPLFCCSVAVCREGRAVIGAIYDPIHHELFHGEKGKGAFLNDTRLHTADTQDFESMYCFIEQAGRHMPRKKFLALTEKISGGYRRRLGSAACALAYTAAGRLDGSLTSGLHPWDVAAGCLLIEEAGGKVCDFHGSYPDLNSTGVNLIAGSQPASEYMLNNLNMEALSEKMV